MVAEVLDVCWQKFFCRRDNFAANKQIIEHKQAASKFCFEAASFKCFYWKTYSLSKRASFLSTQIVAKGKKAEISAKTKSSSSHLKILRAGSTKRR